MAGARWSADSVFKNPSGRAGKFFAVRPFFGVPGKTIEISAGKGYNTNNKYQAEAIIHGTKLRI